MKTAAVPHKSKSTSHSVYYFENVVAIDKAFSHHFRKYCNFLIIFFTFLSSTLPYFMQYTVLLNVFTNY